MSKVHFLDVGCADCSVINSYSATILVDCYEIEKYRHLLPTDKKIRGVFITHQHHDHFDGLEYLIDNNYHIDILIHSPYERRYNDNSVDYEEWNNFNAMVNKLETRGTKIYKPYRQENFESAWWESNGFKVWMIGPYRYIADDNYRELHDACLVFRFDINNSRILFAGDASDKSLNAISRTNHICDGILHASHHGSIEGADLDFIKASNANYTIVSTKSGVYDSVPNSTALQRYRNNTKIDVKRTDLSGTIVMDL